MRTHQEKIQFNIFMSHVKNWKQSIGFHGGPGNCLGEYYHGTVNGQGKYFVKNIDRVTGGDRRHTDIQPGKTLWESMILIETGWVLARSAGATVAELELWKIYDPKIERWMP